MHKVELWRYKYCENLNIITVFSFFRGALAPPNDYAASPLMYGESSTYRQHQGYVTTPFFFLFACVREKDNERRTKRVFILGEQLDHVSARL
jgi:hypothetical protein